MNYIDYLIGLGLGVVITLILRAVSDARREKETKQRKHAHEHINFNGSIVAINNEISEIFERIEKLDSLVLECGTKTVELDMRLEKLEAKKK